MSNKKNEPSVENLAKRLEVLEKRIAFMDEPAIWLLLDRVVYRRKNSVIHQHPMVRFLLGRLKQGRLTPMAKEFITSYLERCQLEQYEPHNPGK